jgi:hypothetical protein
MKFVNMLASYVIYYNLHIIIVNFSLNIILGVKIYTLDTEGRVS